MRVVHAHQRVDHVGLAAVLARVGVGDPGARGGDSGGVWAGAEGAEEGERGGDVEGGGVTGE